MKPLSSSNNPEKISGEDRSKKKKIKSKSAKRCRGHRDSSSSSYSDWDSEEISRSRRKRSKSKKLVGKRKGGLKKSLKKSMRKKKRSRRGSSVSNSSSGCSTCSDSERLRNPVRQSKVRKKESARGRKSTHLHESSRVRIRNRSPSCSTCSGGSRSRSSSSGRSGSLIKERFERKRKRSAPIEGRVESTCERSPVEERLGRCRGRSPIDETFEASGRRPVNDRFESRHGLSPIDEERFESSRGWSPVEDRFGSSGKKRSPIEDASGNSRGLGAIDDRFGRGHNHSPIVERFESGCRDSPFGDKFQSGRVWTAIEQRCESHGQNHIDGRFESSYVQSPIEDRDWEHGRTKRLRSVLVVTKSAGEDGNVIMACDDYPSSRSNVFCDEGNNKRDLNAGDKEKEPCNARFREEVISSNDGLEDEGKEAANLELILRQKALENFKKFRRICHAKLETLDNKSGISEPESDQNLNFFAKMSECKHHNSILGETHSNKSTGRSISIISADKVDENSTRIHSNAQNTLSRLKRVQESSNKISSEQTSLAKDNPSKREGDQPSRVKVSGTEVGTADNPASGACNTENQNLKSGESMVESANRSQFEEKTFSRMRDGEMVQVSYKVYIPNKTPALARRKLQR